MSAPFSSASRPCVRLVGAGPGDPDLLTIKALKALQSATVVLVDDLVSDAILALIPADVRVVQVGKRGGCQSTPQAFIHKLMVQAALEGEQVVRLKGGDPFLFGRGGEEVEYLHSQGIATEVINGITAGLAGVTSLGVALTHREHAHGVVFVTGHAKPGDTGTDWVALARTAHQARLTVVIYMGVKLADQIQQQLLQGLPADTPVAIVQHVSLPQQRQVVTRLDALSQTLLQHQLGSPSIIVVGDVIAGVAAATASLDVRQAAQA
jgi:uroporphyrin-III C-methyltransferase